MVPVEASFIDAIRRGSVVEFSTAPAADAPRMRGQLVASQVGPEFYWNQFDAQGLTPVQNILLLFWQEAGLS